MKTIYLILFISFSLLSACKKDEDGERNRLRYTVQGTMYKDIDFVPLPDYPLELVLVPPDGSSRDFKTLDRCFTGKNGSYKFNYISKMREGTLLIWQDESKLQKGQAILGPFVKDLELNKNIDMDFTYNRGAFAIVDVKIKTQKTYTDKDTLYFAYTLNADSEIAGPTRSVISPQNNHIERLYLPTTKRKAYTNDDSTFVVYGLGAQDLYNAKTNQFVDSIRDYNRIRVKVEKLMKPQEVVLELK